MRKDTLAQDAYVFGYSIVSRMEAADLRSCLKISHERSLMSQSNPEDEDVAAVQQMADLLEMCAALKSALAAAVRRIGVLEEQHEVASRELASVKLKLQLPDQTMRVREGDQVRAAEAGGSEVVATTPPVTGDDALVAAARAPAREPTASSESSNAIVPAAAATRARHSSGSSDIIITEYHSPVRGTSPAVGFTFPAKERRRLVKATRAPRISRSASPATRSSPVVVTQNRFAALSDDGPTEEVNLKVYKRAAYHRKVYVGRFDSETSEATFRAYLRRRVVKNELDIDDVLKLNPQSRSTTPSCSFCVTVSSTTARNALFEKSAWPAGVTVRDFKPAIPKGSKGRHTDERRNQSRSEGRETGRNGSNQRRTGAPKSQWNGRHDYGHDREQRGRAAGGWSRSNRYH